MPPCGISRGRRHHHDAAEEDAAEGRAFTGHRVDDTLGHVREQPLLHGLGEERVRRVGAHAAGVGAGVAFADALVVLRGGEEDGVPAVTEGEEGELVAVKELFEDDLGDGRAEECAGEHVVGGRAGLRVRFGR